MKKILKRLVITHTDIKIQIRIYHIMELENARRENIMICLTWFLMIFAAGNAGVLPKIRGGANTTIDQVPWEVMLNVKGVIHCGGSIISKNYILSAASCVYPFQPDDFVVRSGTTFYSAGGDNTAVDSIKQHPGFNTADYDYDVAVFKLKTPLNISDLQKPVTLSLTMIQAGSLAQIAGWGTGVGEGYSETLQSVQVPIADRQTCIEVYSVYRNVTDRMICAGSIGKDACGGDFGAALTRDGLQYGLPSWGNGCGVPGFPTVYSNVASMKEFIDSNSNNEASWK